MTDRDDRKLLLGLGDNTLPLEKLTPILKQFDVSVEPTFEIAKYGLRFYSIQSQTMREYKHTCFGMYAFVDIDKEGKELLKRKDEDEHAKKRLLELINTRTFLLDDAIFWVSFVHEYLNLHDEIWLYHSDNKIPMCEKPLIEIYSNELRAEHFLMLEHNQAIVIRKRE